MTKNILDEITHVVRTLTDRTDLKVCGSYDEDKNQIFSVQINSGKTPIPAEDLMTIRDLYNLRFHKVYDNRKKGYSGGLGRNIRYLLGISMQQLSLIL